MARWACLTLARVPFRPAAMHTKKPIVPGEEAKVLNVAITKHIH